METVRNGTQTFRQKLSSLMIKLRLSLILITMNPLDTLLWLIIYKMYLSMIVHKILQTVLQRN